MSKYTPLQTFLKEKMQNGVTDLVLTFTQIEQLINSKLPDSAREHRTWWANTHPVVYPKPWTHVGWMTYDVNMSGEQVFFTCVSAGHKRALI